MSPFFRVVERLTYHSTLSIMVRWSLSVENKGMLMISGRYPLRVGGMTGLGGGIGGKCHTLI